MCMPHLHCDILSSYKSRSVSSSSLKLPQCPAQFSTSNRCRFGKKVDRMGHVTHFTSLNLYGAKANLSQQEDNQFIFQSVMVCNIRSNNYNLFLILLSLSLFIEGIPCATHSDKCFTYIISFNLHKSAK